MKLWSLLALFVLISSCPASRHHGVGSIVNKPMFEKMLKHRNDDVCPAKGFYTYGGFIKAVKKFKGFGTTGSIKARKREIAAFLGQTSHETTGGWETAPDGPFAWGYCFKEEVGASGGSDYCEPDPKWPCAPHKKYFGRGPIQLSYNFNYGPAGKDLGYDLLRNPDAVANNSAISFETALWFWMTPQDPKPSCHDVITGRWKPSPGDRSAGRNPGYGVVTNIVNGGIECGKGPTPEGEDRVGFYKRYCDFLDVSYGPNLDCDSQTPFGSN